MKQMIKEIIPQVHSAVAALIAAVDAHVAGDQDAAAAQFRKANCPNAWAWLNDAWIVPRRNIVVLKPEGDSKPVPKAERDPDRNIHRPVGKEKAKAEAKTKASAKAKAKAKASARVKTRQRQRQR